MNDDEESSEAELSAGEGSERVTHEQPEAAGPHPIRLTHENARQWTIELTGQRPSWRRDLFAYIDQQTAQQEQSEREVASLTSELATAREMIYDAERREEALREELATAQQELEDAWRNDKPITNDQMILNLEEQLRFCYEFRARPLPGGYGPVHAFRKELVEALRELASLVDADLAPRHIAWEKLASRLERGVHQ